MKKQFIFLILLLLVLTGCTTNYPNFVGSVMIREDLPTRSVIIIGEHAEDVDDLKFFFEGFSRGYQGLYVGNTKNDGTEILAKTIELPKEAYNLSIGDLYLNDEKYQKFFVKSTRGTIDSYYTVMWDYEEFSGEMYFDYVLEDEEPSVPKQIFTYNNDICIYESPGDEGFFHIVEDAELLFQYTSFTVQNNIRKDIHLFVYNKDNKTYFSTYSFGENGKGLKTIEIGEFDDCGFKKVKTKGFFYTIKEKTINVYDFTCTKILEHVATDNILGVHFNSYGDYFLNYAEAHGSGIIIKREVIIPRVE